MISQGSVRSLATTRKLNTSPFDPVTVPCWAVQLTPEKPIISARIAIFPFIINRANSVLNKLSENEMDVLPLFSQYTLDIVCKLCFNYNLNSIENPKNNLSQLITEGFSTIDNNDTWAVIIPYYYQLPLPSNLKRRKIINLMNLVIRDFIKEKGNGQFNNDVLQVLMSNNNSYEEIRDHIMTFLLAGNETTSTSLAWLTYLLANNPIEQEHLYKALLKIDVDDINALNECKMLNNVIYESMRLKPAVENSARLTTQPIVYKDKVIPSNTFIMINISGLNMNCENSSDFIPDRWNKEIGQYSYIPFYVGFRSCIGKQLALLELRVMVSVLFKHYKVIKTDATSKTSAEFHITQKPHPGVIVKFEKRLK